MEQRAKDIIFILLQQRGPVIVTSRVTFAGVPCLLVCDGTCEKAWGINARPRHQYDPENEDDYAFLADGELGYAPANPGTSEGGYFKPVDRTHNKWCCRECERCTMVEIKDFGRRRDNLRRR